MARYKMRQTLISLGEDDIAVGEDDALILAIAVALDEMAHDPDEGRG